MRNDLTTKRTSLSTSSDVINTLEYKMAALQEEDKPVQEGLSDYIALALDEIAAQEGQIKELEAQIKERKKELKDQTRAIKEDGAKFLLKYGIEKMVGAIVSSVSVRKGKKAGTKKVFKTELSKKEIEEFLEESGLGYYDEVETEATSDVLVVNKRRVVTPEIEE